MNLMQAFEERLLCVVESEASANGERTSDVSLMTSELDSTQNRAIVRKMAGMANTGKESVVAAERKL